MSKDLWMMEEEMIGELYFSGEIDRDEAEQRSKALGFDPHEIKERLDEIDNDTIRDEQMAVTLANTAKNMSEWHPKALMEVEELINEVGLHIDVMKVKLAAKSGGSNG